METRFLNFHDEEHFSIENFGQSNGFESENSLFGGFISEYDHFDALPLSWTNSDVFNELDCNEEKKEQKEDFHKTFLDWQRHIPDFEPTNGDGGKENIFNEDPIPSEFSDIFNISELEEGEVEDASHIQGQFDLVPIKVEDVTTPEQDPLAVDSFDFIAIKTERESLDLNVEDDSCVDIETIGEEIAPVLEAGDITTLLEQFEASEAVNGTAKPSTLPQTVINKPNLLSKVPIVANKNILEVLPKEVIDRIKESSKKRKVISLVPAGRMPLSKSATRMQDAASTLSRNKFPFLKIVGTSTSGEAVKLDHDYCSSGVKNINSSNNIEYYNFYSEEKSNKKVENRYNSGGSEKWKNNKKDSGLESAENSSDASDASLVKNQPILNSNHIKPGESLLIRHHIKPKVNNIPITLEEIKIEPEEEEESCDRIEEIEEAGEMEVDSLLEQKTIKEECKEMKPEQKKKKLNLEEYRKRRKIMDCIRSSSKSFQRTGGSNTDVIGLAPNSKEESSAIGDDRVLVKVEVQTQENSEIKKEETKEERLRALALEKWGRKRIRSISTSSSSSSGSRSLSSRWRFRNRRHFGKSQRHRSVWSGSRSRSRSMSHSNNSSYSGRSLSRSRSRSHSRGKHHKSRFSYCRQNSICSSKRSSGRRSPKKSRREEDWDPIEKQKQVEERRVVYVGRLEDGTTKQQLRERFGMFGPVVDITLHFRERGDNYGFVTFKYKVDAYEAVEHGNDNPVEPRYDICFGGRRAFCKQRYSDLDGLSSGHGGGFSGMIYPKSSPRTESFDSLLREAQENLRKRSFV